MGVVGVCWSNWCLFRIASKDRAVRKVFVNRFGAIGSLNKKSVILLKLYKCWIISLSTLFWIKLKIIKNYVNREKLFIYLARNEAVHIIWSFGKCDAVLHPLNLRRANEVRTLRTHSEISAGFKFKFLIRDCCCGYSCGNCCCCCC